MSIKLSVTLTCYNHAQFVAEALDAILSQSVPAFQVVVVDDGSTDESPEIIQSFADKNDTVKYIRCAENAGAREARRIAIEATTGDYLYNAASDDRILPGFFEKSLSLLAAHPDAALCTGQSYQMNPDGVITGIFPSPIPITESGFMAPDVVAQKLCTYGAWFMGNTAIYRRDAFESRAALDPSLVSFVDGFLQHVVALRSGAIYIPEPVACWRKMASGFAAVQSRDIARMQSITDTAVALMKNGAERYQAPFPEKYIRDWEKRQTYWMGDSSNSALANAEDAHLTRLAAIDSHWCCRLLLHLTRFVIFVRRKMTGALLILSSATWPATFMLYRWAIRNARAKRRLRRGL